MAMIFEVIKGGGDNLSYVVGCSSSRIAAVVDPISPDPVLEYCRQNNLKISFVLNTHGHPDHTGGNAAIKSATSAKIMAHPADHVPDLDQPLSDQETISAGDIQIQVIHTPGHTAGGLCFMVEDKLISGDTVFLSGAGNARFGGNVDELFKSFRDKILPLPQDTELHPGHDYSESNLAFALSLEPDNPSIGKKLSEVKAAIGSGSIIKSSLKEERQYNPFFRYQEQELIESLKDKHPELSGKEPFEVFKFIRELRNNW